MGKTVVYDVVVGTFECPIHNRRAREMRSRLLHARFGRIIWKGHDRNPLSFLNLSGCNSGVRRQASALSSFGNGRSKVDPRARVSGCVLEISVLADEAAVGFRCIM